MLPRINDSGRDSHQPPGGNRLQSPIPTHDYIGWRPGPAKVPDGFR